MEQQSINLYADSISIKEQADWEAKIRQAVIENSAEYKQEQVLAAMEPQSTQAIKTPKQTTNTQNRYERNGQYIYFRPNLTDCLLMVIAFFLLLILIFK